ncbi:MAG: Clp protease ClpP [Oscillospiraceae bacterium]|nr:Clp protease ClpP [Oscillospiraceae bacterium]
MPKNNSNEKYYNIAANDDAVEIDLYGEIVSERPINWWTGEKDDGNYIAQDEFIKELDKIGIPKMLNIRISSFGGEVAAALVIYNRLRDLSGKGTHITCVVDGVAMSAGSLIICAAHKISATESSLIMIHKSLTLCFGWYNADELRKLAETSDAYDKAIVATYKRKTGKSEDELLTMMSEELYMTGKEALDLGFVDELLESDDTPEIAASADRTALYVGGRRVALFGAKCPENIPTVTLPEPTTSGNGVTNIKPETNIEGGNSVDNNNSAQTPSTQVDGEAIKKAVAAERERLQKIDEIADQFSADTVKNAKYGSPCTAEEMAYRAAVESAKLGQSFLRDVSSDNRASGVQEVNGAVAPDDFQNTSNSEVKTEEQKMAEARAVVRRAMGGDT